MSTPSNPIVRAIVGVATGGLSEVPGQFKTVTKAVVNLASGKNPLEGLKPFGETGSPLDVLRPASPLQTNPITSPTISPRTTPLSTSASLRRRRNFSTLLTGAAGDTSEAPVKKNTLLGGQATTLGA